MKVSSAKSVRVSLAISGFLTATVEFKMRYNLPYQKSYLITLFLAKSVRSVLNSAYCTEISRVCVCVRQDDIPRYGLKLFMRCFIAYALYKQATLALQHTRMSAIMLIYTNSCL